MSVSPARRAAYEVLLRVFEHEAYADRVFRSAAAELDERDRAFAHRLAYGAVQRVRTLDYAIETLGKRPVRKLDPPVRAALRLGAYQLAYTETAPHAAANESVELVRRARLERAVPFTNAIMRRLADGIRPLLDGLPDGPLKESYPDWIYDVWVRDLGAADALALMRTMNEPLETVVRLVSGDPPAGAEPTDVPGAYRVERVDDLAVADGRIWPQSRGSQLAGLAVGSQDGERVLDLCAAPGGKTTQLHGEVTAVEADPHRASELRDNLARLHADNVTVVEADGTQLPPDLNGFDRALVDAPCSGLGVLAQRPDLRWRARPLPELQLALLRSAAERVRPGGTIVYSVCTMNADENEAVVEASGLRVAAARGGVAGVRPPEAAGVPAHAAACPRDDRLLRRPPRPRLTPTAGRRTIGRRRWHGRNGSGRWRSSRPSMRRTSATSAEQTEVLLRTGARIFHFDVGDGHFVEPITMGPIVLQSIAPRIHGMEGVVDCHLMVDNPLHHFPQIATSGGNSVTFHYEAVDDVPATIAAARELGLGVGVAFNPETEPEDVAAVATGADLVLCMSIHPGYSGQEFMPEALGRIERLRAALPEHVHVQVDGGVDNDNVRSIYDAGATLIVAGNAIFSREDLPRSYRRLVQALA